MMAKNAAIYPANGTVSFTCERFLCNWCNSREKINEKTNKTIKTTTEKQKHRNIIINMSPTPIAPFIIGILRIVQQ
jgi:hypothetical protein